MYRTAWNPGDSPVVVDTDGRTIGGNEWGTVDTTDETAKAQVASGSLLLLDAEPEQDADVNPALLAAGRATAEMTAAADALRALDKPVLMDLAEEHAPDLIDEDGKAKKADLVDGLAVRGVEPEPQTPPVKKAAAKTTTSERA